MPATQFDVDKHEQFTEWYNTVVQAADLVDQQYGAKGFVVRTPMTMLMVEQLRNFYEREFHRTGHLPVQFPTVVPEQNFYTEQEHVEGFAPEVFWVSEAGSQGTPLEERLALKPTGETAMYPSYARWIRSHRDLPLKLYQFGSVFRYETKMTKPFLREREFLWFESHNVFATRAEMEEQIAEDMEMTERVVYYQLGVPFFYMQRPAWDKFAGAKNTYTADVPLPNGKSLQIGSTHELGQNFSEAFDITFFDTDKQERYAWQTCWGPGVSRQIAATIAVHGDNNGLILPFALAPYQAVIVPVLFGDDTTAVMKQCEEIQNMLTDHYRIYLDDSDNSPGEKYNHWELHGACCRIEIGPKEVAEQRVTIVRRDTGEKLTVSQTELYETLADIANTFTDTLRQRAEQSLDTVLVTADSYTDMQHYLEKEKTVRIPFCSIESGESCAERIKEDTTAEVRGINVQEDNHVDSGSCIVCDAPAAAMVYVAIDY